MSRLVSKRVKKLPQTGITSDRYEFLGLEQAEPNLGDPLVGPSSIGANPIKAGTFYQLAAIAQYPGERFWSSPVGIGTTLGVISVYANNELPNSAFSRIHGLNFVGSGVSIETPPLELFDGIGIATIRFAAIELIAPGNAYEIPYHNPNTGLLSGASNFVFRNNNVGIGSTLPKEKLDISGSVNITNNLNVSGITTFNNVTVSSGIISSITGVVTYYGDGSNLTDVYAIYSNNSGISTSVIGGIASVTQLNVIGISTFSGVSIVSGIISSTTGVVTYYGDGSKLSNIIADSSTYASIAGFSTVAGYASTSGISTYATSSGISTYATSSGISTYATSSGIATVSEYSLIAGIATYATTAGISTVSQGLTGTPNIQVGIITATEYYGTFKGTVDNANYATTAGIATYSISSGIATYSSIAGIATYATTAGIATYSASSGIATYATTAGISTYATSSGIATYATSAGIATYATSAGIATYATLAGISTYSQASGISTVSQGLTGTPNIQVGIITATEYYGTFKGTIDGTVANANYANVAGFATISGISTYATSSGIATYATTAGIATYSASSGIATYATSAGIATYATLAGYSTTAGISTVSQGLTGTPNVQVGIITATEYYGTFKGTIDGTVANANYANVAGFSTVSGYATTAGIATYSTSSGIATYATSAGIATYATTAGIATYSTSAGIATYATTAGISTVSQGLTGTPNVQVGIITATEYYGTFKGTIDGTVANANYANVAGVATYATTAGIATYSTSAGIATYATTAGISTVSQGLTGTPNIQVGIITATEYYGTFKGTIDGTVANANYANVAGVATYATTAGIATYATTAGIATYATTAGISTVSQGLTGTPNVQVGIITATEYYGTFKGTIDSGVILDKANYANIAGISTVSQGLTGTPNIEVGIVTAISISGSGTNITNLNATNLTSGIVPAARITDTNELSVNGNLFVSGNISFGGTTTQLNAQQLQIIDPDIILGIGTTFSPSDNTANHGGIAIASTEGSPLVNLNITLRENTPTTYKKFMWFKNNTAGLGTDAWLSNYAIGIGSTQFPVGTRLAVGSIKFSEYDLFDIRNINSSGIITATEYYGTFKGSIDSGVILDKANYANVAGFATVAGIATYSTSSGIATYSQAAGISTVSQGLTGTPNIQVGIITATEYYGTFKGTIDGTVANANYANVAGFATVSGYATTAGIATYSTSSGIATYATSAGISTVSQGLTGTPNVQVGIITATEYYGTFKGTIDGTVANANYANVAGVATYAITAGIATYSTSSGIATYATSAGISTVSQGLTGTPNIQVGIITATEYYGTFKGTIDGTVANANYANVAGFATVSGYATTAGIATYATTAGIATYSTSSGIATYATSAGISTVSQGLTGTPNIQVGIITATEYYGTFKGTIDGTVANANYANVAGVATSVIGGIASVSSLNVSGISTLGTVRISSGIVTATSGIITYYGDGSKLFGVTAGVGIQSSGQEIGTNFTTLNFIGTGNTFSSNGTIVNISINSVSNSIFSGYANTAGISTNVIGGIASVSSLNVSGISTLGTVRISSGIVTATSGIITYYGDGSNLSGISGGVTVVDDVSTNAIRYVLFDDVTGGTISSVGVSSSKLQFNPSTGTLSATVFTSLSDKTKKTNIQSISNAIEITKKLNGVRFDWIENGKPSIGVIAQEIEKILPEVVSTNANGLKSVSYGNIVAVLVEAIKEQQIRIEELEKKLNA